MLHDTRTRIGYRPQETNQAVRPVRPLALWDEEWLRHCATSSSPWKPGNSLLHKTTVAHYADTPHILNYGTTSDTITQNQARYSNLTLSDSHRMHFCYISQEELVECDCAPYSSKAWNIIAVFSTIRVFRFANVAVRDTWSRLRCTCRGMV